MPAPDETHYRTVAQAMLGGQVVPLLGAGVNLCDRPKGEDWQPGRHLPSGGELTAHLAVAFNYPKDEPQDLLRVSQYVEVTTGSGPLYHALRKLFDADYRPTRLHRLLAHLPQVLRDRGEAPYQLIVTTNYDDALECAFRKAGEEYDLIYYLASGEHRGKFMHIRPDGKAHLIHRPNKYPSLSLNERTVIVKIHGAVDRVDAERDSYVITEDHYVDYLTRTDVSTLLPITVRETLRHSHILLLGYSMRDWNLRVILHRIWGERARAYRPWAIQLDSRPIDEKLWQWRGVEILHVPLEEYVEGLAAQLGLTDWGGGAP